MEHRQPGRSWPGREPVVGIGLMSGTSADGVDAVAVRLQEQTGSLGCELLAQVARPYPAALRSALFQCFSNSCDARHLCLLNAALGEFYADAAQEVVSQLPDVAVDFVACHGQTIWHETTPDAGVRAERPPFADPTLRATFQIGEAARIAERLGIPVVSDFRQQDLALGGEGAPLVPSVDYLLFRSPDRARAIQNLGGIGNVTYLPAGCGPEQVIAFDTGPANCWMDRAAERTTNGRWRFDLDGQLARAGKTDPGLLERLLDEERDFLERPPPKSTGRERYSTAAVD
ncbi:MAG: anhydro-N-acetylmuramic acid kinase, partial [Armatimonadetes bacterium]|nr:anhydro-N-acetylmuramic acid kinase [Armatimonadota bacterium]